MARWRKALKGVGVAVGVVALAGGGAVAWAASAADATLSRPEEPLPALVASRDPAVIARGEYLARGPAHCAICHTGSDRDHPEEVAKTPFRGGLAFEMGPLGTRYAPNLTPDPETGIGRWTDAQLARTLRTGVTPSGELSIFMTYSVGYLSDDDIVAILSYLRSLEPVRHEVPKGEWSVVARSLMGFGAFRVAPRRAPPPVHVPPAEQPTVERGRYLAEHAAFCAGCHTPSDPATFQASGPAFSGGNVEPSHGKDSDFEYAPPNLTSAPSGYVGRVDEDAFVQRMRAGRTHLTSIMPWECYAIMTDADLKSIYRFLRSVPPATKDTGPPYRKIGSFAP
ncbi:MAG: c-type cytochrome [Polyangiaceae bacterium]|nr:c-type cytochrome [Polyangiaceae bacterium]